jgi:hypothetical protein
LKQLKQHETKHDILVYENNQDNKKLICRVELVCHDKQQLAPNCEFEKFKRDNPQYNQVMFGKKEFKFVEMLCEAEEKGDPESFILLASVLQGPLSMFEERVKDACIVFDKSFTLIQDGESRIIQDDLPRSRRGSE